MDELIILKAKVYDLLVQKQNIEAELQRVNKLIAEQLTKAKDPSDA